MLGSDDVIAKVVQSPAISLKLTGMEGMPTAKAKAKSMEPKPKPRPKAKPKAKVMPRVKAKAMPKALKARVKNQRLGAAPERLRTALGSQTDAEKEEEAVRNRALERIVAERHRFRSLASDIQFPRKPHSVIHKTPKSPSPFISLSPPCHFTKVYMLHRSQGSCRPMRDRGRT